MKVLDEIRIAGERLTYRLISDETEDCEPKKRVSYGVSISTTLFGEEEEETVTDIYCDYDKAERFLRLLADNTVLPSTLKEIVREYIAAEYTV